ncbi:MAG: choice-of-anchor D domain-containing protein, partial [Bdellovibrionales bacterium]|nr:choice-of-anchor D domain-containing protein [Bdellovibrionales bacterium]
LTATGQNPTFVEGGAAASLYSGASASTVETGQAFSSMSLTVSNVTDGTSERAVIDGSTVVLTHGTSGTTASNGMSYSVSMVGSTATVSLSGGTLSASALQSLVNAMSYQNTNDNPTTSNRVVMITSVQDSGGTANGGDDFASLTIASTVTVVGVNDQPTLTATGTNPTFVEGGAAASLYAGASASTIESGQTFLSMTLTATNITDTGSEILNVDGTAIVLDNGVSGTTATNSLSYSVSVASTTATVSLTGGTVSSSALQTLVDAISYQNNSNDPATSNRVVTITAVQDSGGTANGGIDTTSLSIASTVGVTAANDEPTLAATGQDPTFTENGSAVSLYAGASADTVESGQTLVALSLSVTNVTDGAAEILNADGSAVALTHGNTGTTATNSLSYTVVVVGSTATVILTGGTLSEAALAVLVDGLTYQNNSDSPGTSSRVVTLTSLQDSGGTANGGDDTAALAIVSTVTVVALAPPVITDLDGDAITYLEGDGPQLIDSSDPAQVTDADSADFNGGNLSVSIFSGGDAAEDLLSLDTSGGVTLGGTTAGSAVSVGGVSVGTLANNLTTGNDLIVSLTSGATPIRVTTLLQAVTYENVDTDIPTGGARTIRVTISDGDGETSAASDVTVAVQPVNDKPVVGELDGDSFAYEAGDGAQVLDQGTQATLTDLDSSDFSGGALVATIAAGEDGAEDQLSFDTSGNVQLAGTTAGSNVSVSSVIVGTLGNSIGAGVDLVVNLNASATQVRVRELIRAATYENLDTALPTAGNRTVRVTVSDGDGGTSDNSDVTISVAGVPDINLTGLATSIASGDATPSTVDGTDFGGVSVTVGTALSTFVIENAGTGTLSLGGTPLVSITGSDAAQFSVTTEPSNSVAAASSTSFIITFSPTSLGEKTATVSIASDDPDENPYTFAIRGEGLADNDQDGLPDVTDPDDDNDGVTDVQEAIDGTDSLSDDSFVERAGQTTCINWNGFLDFLTQIVEVRNSSGTAVTAELKLFDIGGSVQDTVAMT